jgi:hypothetical protein
MCVENATKNISTLKIRFIKSDFLRLQNTKTPTMDYLIVRYS